MSQSALLALRIPLDLPCGPPLHLTATLGTSPQAVGLLFGLAVLAASIVAPPVGALADRVPPATLVAGGTLGAAGAFALIGTARTLPSIGIGLALVAIAGQLVLALPSPWSPGSPRPAPARLRRRVRPVHPGLCRRARRGPLLAGLAAGSAAFAAPPWPLPRSPPWAGLPLPGGPHGPPPRRRLAARPAPAPRSTSIRRSVQPAQGRP